ncbi:MAG TPA: pyridoxal-phosphate dependent enzyme [Acidimicrobiales bacterium]|nr:pyridoxal-phosphate dependent enzyme [Acidimicrobiales bacterium]
MIGPLSGSWRCGCGGQLDLAGPPADPVADLPPARWSMWRYLHSMPQVKSWKKTTLGEGVTPLVEIEPGVLVKQEQLSPTGSFKDRGASLLIALASDLGASSVVVDSSGNAGKAVAAYAARAGLAAEIYVPSGTVAAKTDAAESHGARVVVVDGDRAAAGDAARSVVERSSSFYASHVHQPAFVHGVKTVAFEIWEQLGGRPPGSVVVPAGNGTLVQGMWLGFSELHAARRVERLPRIFAVQADRCAPLAGLKRAALPTAASGIAIPKPPRAGQVRAAVVASRGSVLTVPEEGLVPAQEDLARRGVSVEITSAAVWAALRAGVPTPDEPVVVVLTGR